MMLVSLEQTSTYARRSPLANDDAELLLLIEAASGAVVNYLASGSAFLDFLTSDLEPIEEDSDGVTLDVPPVVQVATMYLAAFFYNNKDRDDAKAFTPGFLPAPVTALLYPLRDPVMA